MKGHAMKRMKRRDVLHAGAALAALPLLPRAARAAEESPPKAACERVIAKVGGNHGHVFQVSAADVKAAVDRTYDLTGAAGHPHTVTLSADDFRRLGAGEVLRRTSSRDGGHQHRLLVKCAPRVDPPESVNVCQIEIGGKDDHEFAITAADMTAKAERAYDIQGVAVHTHTVRISAEGFERLARGEALTVTASPGDGHTHVVFVRYPVKGKGP
jgi:hypothetical protein